MKDHENFEINEERVQLVKDLMNDHWFPGRIVAALVTLGYPRDNATALVHAASE